MHLAKFGCRESSIFGKVRMPTLEHVLDAADPSDLPLRTQVLLRRWYGREPGGDAADQVRDAVRALRWTRNVGELDFLPREVRAERITRGSNALSIEPDRLVHLMVTADGLIRELDSVGSRTELIVAFEGLDSSGKTTQIEMLRSRLVSQGIDSRIASSPRYESLVGQEIMRRLHDPAKGASETDPMSMALWYATDRWRHFNDLQLPVAAGMTILNRFTLSNAVYQASRVEPPQRMEMFRWVVALEREVFELPQPDITFFIDVDPAESLNRSRDRVALDDRASTPDVYEQSLELQVTAREMYLAAAEQDPTIHVLPGARAALEIARDIQQVIDDAMLA